jgi:TPR repeat protein/tRNA A-37 threonylcarbamoyl transferase component Bud32
MYGSCLFHGEGVEIDLIGAAKYYKSAADQHLPPAQFNYGYCLERGKGVQADLVGAVHYYKLAADQNLAQAQFAYGLSLAYVEGVRIDLVEAAKYYRLAADQNLNRAQFNYACCLRHGRGVKIDLFGAAKYSKLAAGQPPCDPLSGLVSPSPSLTQFDYALRRLEGNDCRIDLHESAKYFRLAAGLPCQDGRNRSRASEDSEFEAPITPTVGRELCVRTVEWGCFHMLTRLGSCFEFGWHSPKDVALAAKCYLVAAEGGDPAAQLRAAFCFEHGLGVERDVSKSFAFYEKSAGTNISVAVGHCALGLHFGVGLCEDVESASDYYDVVRESLPSFVLENTVRCRRGLHQPPVPKSAVNKHPVSPLHQSAGMAGTPSFANGGIDGLYIPESIRRYRVDAIRSKPGVSLGIGVFAEVTLEKDPKNPQRNIALKRSHSRNERADCIREIERMVKLKHPCIIAIRGWSQSDSNTIEIQMQLAENGALSDHLNKYNFISQPLVRNPTRKAQLICDIVLGMRYIHSHGIIHRDLKPANILLDGKWRGLIGDFGWSRSTSAQGPPTAKAGTPLYAAPEMLTPGCRYNERVDVFAFALVLYEIIGNVPAFRGGRTSGQMPAIPDEFGPCMQQLIPRCWSSDPNDRPSFQAILDEFQGCGFAILPGADGNAISQAVSEILAVEKTLGQRARTRC